MNEQAFNEKMWLIAAEQIEENIIHQCAKYLGIEVIDIFLGIKEMTISLEGTNKEQLIKFERMLRWNNIIPKNFQLIVSWESNSQYSFKYSNMNYCFLLGNNVPEALIGE